MLTKILVFLFDRKGETMALVYATLIIKGKKIFAQVPASLKEQVREILVDIDCEHLIGE